MRGISEILRWHLYVPHGWGHVFSPDYCAQSVHDTGRSVGFHQCCFGVKETIEGHGWCKRHARELREALKSASR